MILRDAGFEALPGEHRWRRRSTSPRVSRPTPAIIDLVLPDGDGVELCRRLREWSQMPLIVLSAVGDEDAKVRALAAGADDYVTKPFGPRELVARLQANLRRDRARARGGRDPADGLEVDLARRDRARRRRGGPSDADRVRAAAPAGAQPRAADDPPRPADAPSGAPGYGDDTQVLRAHIANLRRKIEPAEGRGYIRTDPGVGYRFAG